MQMKNLALLCLAGLSGLMANTGTFALTMSGTATQLPCSSPRYVHNLNLSVVPGGGGKVYIGGPSLNVTTLANTVAILYPNAGAHSETFKLSAYPNDGLGVADGPDSPSTNYIDLCNYYIAGTSGDTVTMYFYYTGSGSTGGGLSITHSGPFSIGSGATRISSSSTEGAQIIRVQVTPGNADKVYVGHPAFIGHESDGMLTGVAKVMWPNAGTLSQHGAWSESWEMKDPQIGGGLSPYKVVVWDATTTETPIVATWSLNGASADGNLDFEAGPFTATTANQQFSSGLGTVASMHFSMVPGTCSKVFIGLWSTFVKQNTSSLASVYKVLYPTSCSGGWSEEFSYGPELAQNNYDTSRVAIAGQSGGEVITWWTLTNNHYGTGAFMDTSYTIQLSSSTPVALVGTCAGAFTARVVPGGAGKVHIGRSNVSVGTPANTAAILYPNGGAMSEEYTVIDPHKDNIDTPYAIGTDGEILLVQWFRQHGDLCESGTNKWELKTTGTVSNATSHTVAVTSTTNLASDMRIQVVPGGTGKVTLNTLATTGTQPDSTYLYGIKTLWPNTGSLSVSEGHSETVRLSCIPTAHASGSGDSALNCLDQSLFSFWPYVSSEQVLVGSWGRKLP